jgi:hypothetical protein
MKQRPNLGFDTALDDLSGFQAPSKPHQRDAGSKDKLAGVAKASGFGSREGADVSERKVERPRRRRTGRNAQLNIKARPETIAEFCRIADANGWGFGETLEHAVELMRNRVGDADI